MKFFKIMKSTSLNFLTAIQTTVKDFIDVMIKKYEITSIFFELTLLITGFLEMGENDSFISYIIAVVVLTRVLKFFLKQFYFEKLGVPKLRRRYTSIGENGEVKYNPRQFHLILLSLYCFEDFAERNGFYKNEE